LISKICVSHHFLLSFLSSTLCFIFASVIIILLYMKSWGIQQIISIIWGELRITSSDNWIICWTYLSKSQYSLLYSKYLKFQLASNDFCCDSKVFIEGFMDRIWLKFSMAMVSLCHSLLLVFILFWSGERNRFVLMQSAIQVQSIPFIVNGSVPQKMFTCAGYSL
jgi:hypothetical protein